MKGIYNKHLQRHLLSQCVWWISFLFIFTCCVSFSLVSDAKFFHQFHTGCSATKLFLEISPKIHSIWKLDWSGGTVCINGEIRPILTLNGKLPQRAEEKLIGLGRGYGGWGQTRWKNNNSTGRCIFPHHFLCLFFLFVSNPLIFPTFFGFYNPRW